MNATLVRAAAVVLAILIAAPAPSAAAPDDAAPAPEAAKQPVKVMGRLVTIEGNDLVISARRPGGDGAREDVRVTLDENDAAIYLDGQPAEPADLKPGMIVDFAELRDGRPPGHARFRVNAQIAGFSATVVKVDGNNLVVKARQPDGQQAERTVVMDEKTEVRRSQGRPGQVADLRPDARVYITPETGTAARVRIIPERGPDALGQPRQAAGAPLFGPRMTGTLVKVDGKTIVVRPKLPDQRADDTGDKAFPIDENTRFLIDGEPGKLEDLNPQMQLSVTAAANGGPAQIVTGQSRGRSGVVARVEGANVVLRLLGREERGKEVTVATDEQTRIIYVAGIPRTPKSPTVADLRPDMMVSVIPETGVAKKIIVLMKVPTPARQ